jgi:predicted membrane protein (TIGR00267 family)
VRDEFGIDLRMAQKQGAGPAFAMGGSFVLGAFVPIVPYLTPLSLSGAIGVALLLAICVLFGIGVFAGRLSGRNPIRKGLEITAFGAGLFVVSYVMGHFIPPLFGKNVVNVGG